MKTIKIATWNVNSVRARKQNIEDFLKNSDIDILLMQETKCKNDDFPEDFFIDLGYNVKFSGQPSYNGVAIAAKHNIDVEHFSLPLYGKVEEDNQARYIEATVTIENTTVRAASIYVPNGDSVLPKGSKLEDSEKFIFKMRFFDRLKQHMANSFNNDNEVHVFGGDYNVAHHAIDLHNPKSAEGGVGFHKMERQHLTDLETKGYVDLFRRYNDKAENYSWWNYRHGGWPKNKGWRIDYIFTPQQHLPKFSNCYIDKDVRGWEKASDHVPVVAEIIIE